MDSLFIYFSINDKNKALYYLQRLHQIFAEVFRSEYKGFNYKNNDDLLKDIREDVHEIWGVLSKTEECPYSQLKFWNVCFSISLQPDYYFGKKYHLHNYVLFGEKARIFAKKVIEELPILALHFWNGDEPFENGWTGLLKPENAKYIHFGYVQKNGKLEYIEGSGYM